jgi:hypothetical protein
MREEEYLRMLRLLKNIDFADVSSLKTLFLYHFRDELDQIELANDTTKDYHQGKFDPENVKTTENKKKKKLRLPKTKAVAMLD